MSDFMLDDVKDKIEDNVDVDVNVESNVKSNVKSKNDLDVRFNEKDNKMKRENKMKQDNKIKIRLHGTTTSIKQTKNDLKKIGKVISCSGVYKNRKDDNFRVYLELELG